MSFPASLCRALAALLLTTALSAAARADASAYLRDARQGVVRNADGVCWRVGTWAPADALLGCDGVLAPPLPKLTAPPVREVVEPPYAPALPAAAPAPAAPLPCHFSIELGGEDTFAFDSTSLNATAQARLRNEMQQRLSTCKDIQALKVTGHADRIGSPAYNLKLSERRAEQTASVLESLGLAAPIQKIGKAASEPKVKCDEPLAYQRLLACLAPNRRVVIDVFGLQAM